MILLLECKLDIDDTLWGESKDDRDFLNRILSQDKIHLHSEEVGDWIGELEIYNIREEE